MKRTHVCICSHPNKQDGCGRNKINQTEIMRQAGKRCEQHNTCYIRGTACWHVKRMRSACTSLSAQWSYAANDNKEVISPGYYVITIKNYLLASFEYVFYILRHCNLRNIERWCTVHGHQTLHYPNIETCMSLVLVSVLSIICIIC